MQIRLTLITALMGLGPLMLLPAETLAQGASGIFLPRQVAPSPLPPTPAPAYPELFPAGAAAPFSEAPVQLAPTPSPSYAPTVGDLASAISAPDASFDKLSALEDVSNGVLRLEKISFIDAAGLIPSADAPAYKASRAANQGRLKQRFIERSRSTIPIKVTKTGTNQVFTLDQALDQINPGQLTIDNIVAVRVYDNDQVIFFFDKSRL